jgi:hypothetical protein
VIIDPRVARFIWEQDTKMGRKYLYKISLNIPDGNKIYQMAVTYTKWPLTIT